MLTKRRIKDVLDAAIDRWWQLQPAYSPPVESIWRPDGSALAGVVVTWPKVYQWPPADKWVSHLRAGLARLVPVATGDVAQPYPGIVLVRVSLPSGTRNVAIDYCDRPTVNEQCIEQVAVYFKMQFTATGYPWANVVPGGFVPADGIVYRVLPRLRRQRDRNRFDHEVYGRFGTQFALPTRSRAVELLSGQRRFRYEGGLATIRYTRHLKEIASAKICIDLPGNGDFCFRLLEYWAVGACVIGARPRNVLHVPVVDRHHIVYAKDDLSDLVDLCCEYLADDNAREQVRINSMELFDRFLHRDRLAEYYLHCVLRV